jgi:predicted amidohydrolase YtcJ
VTRALVIRNAIVHTIDESLPIAQAVAIEEDRIAWVGADDEVDAHLRPGDDVWDAEGKTLFPGFIDSHNHVRLGGGGDLELNDAGSLGEIRQRCIAYLAEHPEAEWLEATGWNYGALPGGRTPTADDIQDVAAGRPAFLLSYDAHTVWMDREAMRRFGIGRGTTEVPFGRVELGADGEPTGFLTDFAVMGLSRRGLAALQAVLPSMSSDRQYQALKRSLDMAIAFGITTIVEPQNSPDDVAMFLRAREDGDLRSRLVAAMYHPPGTTPAEVKEFDDLRRVYDDDRFRIGPIKLYVDDVIEPWTAAMLEPYANRPETSGDTFWDPEMFARTVADLESRGFQSFTHATGDRGIRTALDGIAYARQVNGPGDRRHQLVHVECLSDRDLPRFAELGTVACMQPRHCAPEIVADWRANVGEDRWRNAWRFRGLRDSGATLAFSSDWNVAEMDPLVGIYSALTRANLDGSEAWVPEETVDVATAVRAYTMGGAWANRCDHDRGSVTPGKYADLVVLSEDPFAAAVDPRRLLELHVDTTIVAGAVAYRREEAGQSPS